MRELQATGAHGAGAHARRDEVWVSEALEELGKRRAVEEAERAREVAAQDAGAKKAAASVAAKANELTAEKVRELGFDTAVEVSTRLVQSFGNWMNQVECPALRSGLARLEGAENGRVPVLAALCSTTGVVAVTSFGHPGTHRYL